jgi:hypothetical protein
MDEKTDGKIKLNKTMKKILTSPWTLFFVFVATVMSLIVIASYDKQNGYHYTEAHYVIKVERHRPQNVHEEMNLYYDITLENGVEMKSLRQVSVGDTIYFDMYKVGK